MTFEERIQKGKDIHDKIESLKLLEAQAQALTDQNEFLEDCIAEMAMIVYAG